MPRPSKTDSSEETNRLLRALLKAELGKLRLMQARIAGNQGEYILTPLIAELAAVLADSIEHAPSTGGAA